MSLERSRQIVDDPHGNDSGVFGSRNDHVIYQSTTEPTAAPPSMLESMKRVLGQVVGTASNNSSLLLDSSIHDTDNLLHNNTRPSISIMSSR